MRARNIKPGFFKNEDLAELGPYAQILFEGLWCLADQEGKLEDRVKRIAAEVFPYYDPSPSVDTLLSFLQDKNFIIRYQTERLKIIKVINFNHHQTPHRNEQESFLPEPIQKKQVVRKKKLPTKDESDSIQGSATLRPDILNPDSLNPSSLNPDSLNEESGFTDSPPDIEKLSPPSLANFWNELKPNVLPKVFLPLNPKRTDKAKLAIKVRPDPEYWKALIQSISTTPFLLGSNDRGWKADFDFILEKYDKVYEGKYKSQTKVNPKTIQNIQTVHNWLEKEKNENRGS